VVKLIPIDEDNLTLGKEYLLIRYGDCSDQTGIYLCINEYMYDNKVLYNWKLDSCYTLPLKHNNIGLMEIIKD
jgi:hypothetical protein